MGFFKAGGGLIGCWRRRGDQKNMADRGLGVGKENKSIRHECTEREMD